LKKDWLPDIDGLRKGIYGKVGAGSQGHDLSFITQKHGHAKERYLNRFNNW